VEMHPNLMVFPDLKAAKQWMRRERYELSFRHVQVVILANPTPEYPNGCSITFKP
jgi:hypothetical protein